MSRRATLSRDEARRVLAAHVRDLSMGIGVPDAAREAELRSIIDGPAVGDVGPQQVVVRGARAPEVRVQTEREPGADIEEVADTRRRVPLFQWVDEKPVHMSAHAARVAIAEAILAARGPDGAPVLYLVASGLGKVVSMPGRAPVIAPVTDASDLKIAIDAHVAFGTVKTTLKGGPFVTWDDDATFLIRRLDELARLASWSKLGISPPVLRKVRAYPYFDRSGKLVNVVGYNAESECYLTKATDIQRPGPGERPETVLAEWMQDFMLRSFEGGHSMTYAMAAVLTILTRDMIDGPTPLFAVTAAEQGTGKGKLVDALCLAATGDTPWTINYAADPDRLVSEVMTALLSGRPAINLDNIRRKFGGEAIETVLTRVTYEGRLLGSMTPVQVDNLALWLATGNNLEMTVDALRRTIPVRLVSREDGAANRGGWIHDDIDQPNGWTIRNRARILGAFVVMVERWQAGVRAGWQAERNVWRPGSYEAWGRVVGSVCVHAGFAGWGEGIDGSRAAADPETVAYRVVAERVAEDCFRANPLAKDDVRWTIQGERLGTIMSGIEHFAEALDNKRGPVLCRKAWQLMGQVVGRTWDIRGGDDMRAGTLRFDRIIDRGAKAGLFTWRVRE
jgi:hypothetical protein